MTLLEPTKGAPTLIPEVPLVDTNKEVEVKVNLLIFKLQKRPSRG